MSSSILGFYVLAEMVQISSNTRVPLAVIKDTFYYFSLLLLTLVLSSFLLYLSV